MVKQIENDDEFEKYISEDKITVVDFFAVWCGPCKVIAPAVEEFSGIYKDVNFIKVDVDNHNELAAKHQINSMPTFAFFKSGVRLTNFDVIGANKSKLEDHIKKALSS
ncbi:9019_t:CDS:2 [Diversispora eburnea]|uniref:Thioredoxin n=1 Tax=Diversispora eburnea TaxID=1213867 RepID=A0A9N8V1Y0_9GLOM|nr:9019_t:CDS:2 [Diversispora eburnea]